MDDIKAPNDSVDGVSPPRAPNQPSDMEHMDGDEVYHEMEPEQPHELPEKEKSGMKPWLVAVLVVAALIVGAAGVYIWQTSQENTDSTEQLQSQVDDLTRQLEEAQDANTETELDDNDTQIDTLKTQVDTLTAEVQTLTASNEALKTQNDTLTTENEALATACEAATDCEVPQ